MSVELLAEIWFAIIAFEIGLYIMLDGADLGIGMLSLFESKERTRAIMMHVIGPIWDANETWLVIAGGTLFGAFPLAYGIILNALYVPTMMLIFGIILRAVAFEFHEYSAWKNLWSFLFGLGSLIAVLGQGFMAGGLVSGITIADGSFAGGPFDWATPLSFLITGGIVIGYMITGYGYLLRKRGKPGFLTTALFPVSLAILATAFAIVTFYLMPNIIPPVLSIYDAASSPATLSFMLYGIGPLIPIVLAYNFYLYRVFAGARTQHRSEHYG